jgi:1,4-dihydroxy-2-naphthoate octaprenyltransferase
VVPVLVGGGLAAGEAVFRADAFVAALAGAVALQIAANFANDVSDAARGADSTRLGPPRMVASGTISPRQMWLAVWAAIGVAAVAGLWLIAIAGWWVGVIGIASVLALLGYVGGPAPYGYRGWGEVSVFLFFGLIATAGSRFVHDGDLAPDAVLLGVPTGMLVTAILVANNLRDIETDAAAGKRTLAVLVGRSRTRVIYAVLMWGAFVALAVMAGGGLVPPFTALALLAAPLTVPLIRTAATSEDGARLIGVLKGTARVHLLVGIAIALGAAL